MYNYNGDSMNTKYPLILNILSIDDVQKIENNSVTEYINIDIKHPNIDINNYLVENGFKYSYSDINGYIYVDYETFINGEKVLDDIIKNIPTNLNDLELCKYLYIKLAKTLKYDINIMTEKNDAFCFNDINTINNIWGALSNKKATNISYTKTFTYLCSLVGLNCEVIETNNYKYKKNKINLMVDNNPITIICDITQDVPYIQGNFQTRFFGNYNDEYEMDKKIKYINNNYSDKIIEKVGQNINYSSDNILMELLLKTQNIIDVKNIGAVELGIIYEMIFNKYIPLNHISINNLYANNIYNNREHFILISDNLHHYCYNYKNETFLEINENDLLKNIKSERIGIYLKEIIPNLKIIED